MNKKSVKKIAMVLGCMFLFNTATPTMAGINIFKGEYPQGEILSFGSSLTKEQENKLKEHFNAPDDIDAIYVTTEVVVNQLGLDKSMLTTYTGGWYSSAYVKLTNGTGINVTADNLTLVTNDMLANALITSGILNADIIASAPFKVSGESALAGILAGAEEIMGSELSQENKETAQKEIETTLEVAEEIGQKEASTIMNEIKAEVIKDSPTTNIQIENIVVNVTNNYGIELSEATKSRVVETMSDINDLNIDYKEVKDTLKNVGDRLVQDLKDALNKGEEIGMKIKESGIFEKIWSWVKNVWNSFLDLFRGKEPVITDDIDVVEEDNNNSENIEEVEGAEVQESNGAIVDDGAINEDSAIQGDSVSIDDITNNENTEPNGEESSAENEENVLVKEELDEGINEGEMVESIDENVDTVDDEIEKTTE